MVASEGGHAGMKELIGGLWFAGLVAWALLGLLPGLICIALGVLAGAGSWYGELLKARQAESWRKNYPSYKY